MPIIYQALNTVNGKRYIGATKHSLNHRRYQHLNTARGKKPGCRVFAAAIRKYGEKVFNWSVLSRHTTVEEMIALRRSTDSRKKRIHNLDDDVFYESVTAAGQALARSSGLIAAAIQRNGRCGGKRLAYA